MIISFLVFITSAYGDPWGAYSTWWIAFLSLYATSFLHVMAFVIPKSAKSTPSISHESSSYVQTKDENNQTISVNEDKIELHENNIVMNKDEAKM